MDQNERKKAQLEGQLMAFQWVKDQFFSHEHGMTMGQFVPACITMLNAKIKWIKSHDYFKDDAHESPPKIPE